MKNIYLLIPIMVTALFSFSQNIEEEKEYIKQVIQTSYVEGLQNEGDAKKIDTGFHPDFKLLGIDKGDNMWKYPIIQWKEKQIKKRKAGELPLPKDKAVSVKFKSIDITGTAAVAKLEFYIGSKLTYVDYISLYKFESGWKMVSKIFYKI